MAKASSDTRVSPSLASLIAPKFAWAVFGVPVDVNLGSSPRLSRAFDNGTPTLVNVLCVSVDGECNRINGLFVLSGAGDDVTPDDGCCCEQPGIKVWWLSPDEPLPVLSIGRTTLTKLTSKKGIRPLDVSISIQNLAFDGTDLTGDLVVSGSVAGIPFSFDQPFDFPIGGGSITIDLGTVLGVDFEATIYIQGSQVCASLTADGNQIGSPYCVSYTASTVSRKA
jgi:hypothetical protein